jgi:hypothetical protein
MQLASFSKVSALLHLLHHSHYTQDFENYCPRTTREHPRNSETTKPGVFTIQRTFENYCPGMTREHPRNSETTKPGCFSAPHSTNSKGTRLRPWRTAAFTNMSALMKSDTLSAKGIRRWYLCVCACVCLRVCACVCVCVKTNKLYTDFKLSAKDIGRGHTLQGYTTALSPDTVVDLLYGGYV